MILFFSPGRSGQEEFHIHVLVNVLGKTSGASFKSVVCQWQKLAGQPVRDVGGKTTVLGGGAFAGVDQVCEWGC